jgi:membrane protease YdiL (CAAX protease family)
MRLRECTVDEPSTNPAQQESPPVPPHDVDAPGTGASGVFFGRYGLRAGWSLLAFAVLVTALGASFSAIGRLFPPPQPGDPYALLLQNCFAILSVLIATALMAAVERRSVWSYGLRGSRQWRRFATGIVWGFAALTVMLLVMRAGGHFYFGAVDEPAPAAVKFGLLWLAVFFLVGISEEITFRGYLLYTLARGVGFWPAAVLIAILFGAAHSGNSGESFAGVIAAGLFGLFLSFTLKRTGALWWAIGFHWAWDYAESFIYSVPDSGQMVHGHLLSSSFTGPAWITGGTVGPEGSYFIFLLLAIMAVIFALTYKRSQLKKEDYAPPAVISAPLQMPASERPRIF